MTNFPKWQDVRDDIVAEDGGGQAVAEARHRNQAHIDGHRLAERRKPLGLPQAEVAKRMSVTKSRVSQIERGEVSTIEAVARYVQAIGGHIQISAVFGDDLTADQLAVDILAVQLPRARRRRLAFAAVGASTSSRGAAEAGEMPTKGLGRN